MIAVRRSDANVGWVHLLPNLSTQRVLCIDFDERDTATPLAFWGMDLTAWLASDQSIRLPFAAGSFDVVICRMLGSRLHASQQARWLSECTRVLTENGWLYVDVRGGGIAARAVCQTRTARCLRKLGFSQQRAWQLLIERDAVAEILPARGYRSNRNAWRAMERVKETVYGSGARWTAPAHSFLASRQSLPDSCLQQLGRGVDEGSFERLFVNPAKTFFQPSSDGASIAEMFVLPGDERTVLRRRTEFASIARLRGTRCDMSRLVPRISEERTLYGRPVFVIEAFDGVTIDLPVRHMDELFVRAFDALVAFNKQTGRRRMLDEEAIEHLLEGSARAAIERYPEVASSLARLADECGATLRGSEQLLVWIHGDYKLENLVFDRATRNIQAVIDWELACETGLPLTDLMYLLAYREITYSRAEDILQLLQTDFFRTAKEVLPRRLLAEYVREFELNKKEQVLAVAVFFLHHVGSRYVYKPADTSAMERMKQIAAQLEAELRHSHGS